MDRRGALLGPEESGPAHGGFFSGGWICFFEGHGHTDVSECGGWLGPALIKPLVWVSCPGVLFPWCLRRLLDRWWR